MTMGADGCSFSITMEGGWGKYNYPFALFGISCLHKIRGECIEHEEEPDNCIGEDKIVRTLTQS